MTPPNRWAQTGEPDPHAGHYDCERHQLTLGKFTDDELANGAFMNYNLPLDMPRLLSGDKDYHAPITWMQAVKDRIRWLSRRLMAAEARIKELEALLVKQ